MAGGEYFGSGYSVTETPSTARLGDEWNLIDSPYLPMQIFKQDVNGGSFFFFYHSTMNQMKLIFVRKN
jgi:hypothetical protein